MIFSSVTIAESDQKQAENTHKCAYNSVLFYELGRFPGFHLFVSFTVPGWFIKQSFLWFYLGGFRFPDGVSWWISQKLINTFSSVELC